MGGMVAMVLAGRHPELVDRLVLMNTPAPSPSVVGMAPVWLLVMFLYLVPGLNKGLLHLAAQPGHTRAAHRRRNRPDRGPMRPHLQTDEAASFPGDRRAKHHALDARRAPRGLPLGDPEPRSVLALRPDGAKDHRPDPHDARHEGLGGPDSGRRTLGRCPPRLDLPPARRSRAHSHDGIARAMPGVDRRVHGGVRVLARTHGKQRGRYRP